MAQRSDQILKSMPPQQQQEVKKMLTGFDLDDIFDGLDIGDLGKRFLAPIIDWAQENIVPKVTAKNSTAGFILSFILDGLERALTKV